MGNELERFGKILMERVRDQAILHWEKVLTGEMKDKSSKQLFEEFVQTFTEEQQQRIVDISSQVVDTTLHYLLLAIEEENRIIVLTQNDEGEVVEIKKISDGLAGELYTEDGWILKYSKKRYFQP
jgi:hypothetical protein